MAAAATPKLQVKNTFLELGDEAGPKIAHRRSTSLDCTRTLPLPDRTSFSFRADIHQEATVPSLVEPGEAEVHVAASLPPGYSLVLRNEGNSVETPREDTETMLTSPCQSCESTHGPDAAAGGPGPVCEVEQVETKCAPQLALAEGNHAFMHIAAKLPPGGSVTVRNTVESRDSASLLATQPSWPGAAAPLAPWTPQPPQVPQTVPSPAWSPQLSQLAYDAASRTPAWRPPCWAASGAEGSCEELPGGPGLASTFTGSEVPVLPTMSQSIAWSPPQCALQSENLQLPTYSASPGCWSSAGPASCPYWIPPQLTLPPPLSFQPPTLPLATQPPPTTLAPQVALPPMPAVAPSILQQDSAICWASPPSPLPFPSPMQQAPMPGQQVTVMSASTMAGSGVTCTSSSLCGVPEVLRFSCGVTSPPPPPPCAPAINCAVGLGNCVAPASAPQTATLRADEHVMELAEPAPEEPTFDEHVLEEPAPEEPPGAASPLQSHRIPNDQDMSLNSPKNSVRIRNRSLKETPPKLSKSSRNKLPKEASVTAIARQVGPLALTPAKGASSETAAVTLRTLGSPKVIRTCTLCGNASADIDAAAQTAGSGDADFLSPPPGLEMVSNRDRSSDAGMAGTAKRRQRRIQVKECRACGATCRQPVAPRLWCSFYLKMKHPSFELVPMLIGRGGCNTKGIADKTGAKVRVRGKGSGHLEFPTNQEAPTPLMLVVATENENHGGFKQAIQMTVELLRTIELRYKTHCQEIGHTDNSAGFTIGPPCDQSHPDLKAMIRGFMQQTAPAHKMLQNSA